MFGERLKELRIKFGLKQYELAEILNVSQSTIGMYENDQRTPPAESIVKLAEYFNVTTDYLLGHTKTNYSVDTDKTKIQSIIDSLASYESIKFPKEKFSSLDEYIDFINSDEDIKETIKMYIRLDKEDKKAIRRIIENSLK
ncbi:TPA: helix-turn-helix domain-containing protein [Clostridioides difficile]|uniref:helix-turn-helix domain-containing protein n=1 Tax=Clostridioides difficile TaxID=1496 RepID=UPI00097FDC32|nr:helix-turn-helix transcriptional regulator [Clostridioides difficile]MBH7924459.1 helix-turn-helix transcriptional regulator [Clostridioides difficile]MCI4246586.1 helix-turn-helix domain-containing protein [Clostridioides difficile]MCL6805387.1 helix-turn-helix domain-containing protein [Clostridioides difficile]MCP3259903.1 helix-turn-helix domain-containing protein [Clostridioides difficile]MDI7809963.1 helix-turn-helix transcriptional regulator [Clostridioides difficile]